MSYDNGCSVCSHESLVLLHIYMCCRCRRRRPPARLVHAELELMRYQCNRCHAGMQQHSKLPSQCCITQLCPAWPAHLWKYIERCASSRAWRGHSASLPSASKVTIVTSLNSLLSSQLANEPAKLLPYCVTGSVMAVCSCWPPHNLHYDGAPLMCLWQSCVCNDGWAQDLVTWTGVNDLRAKQQSPGDRY